MGAGLAKRFKEGWRVNEGKVGGEVKLEYVELDNTLAGYPRQDPQVFLPIPSRSPGSEGWSLEHLLG